MTTLFTYAILFLGHLCVYLCFKNSAQVSISKSYFSTSKRVLNQKLVACYQKCEKLKPSSTIDENMLLNKSLKHLEFISEFEMYLEQRTLAYFSKEFLQEFEQIKRNAQLSTLKMTNQLNTTARLAV